MKGNSFKHREGIVYSTRADYSYAPASLVETDNYPSVLPVDSQLLRISIDRRHRGGKTVTLISGYVGTSSGLSDLCKHLKVSCGVGGSVKDGVILLQGDLRERVLGALMVLGYKKSKIVGS
jgi:translation initiation factor 1